ncbi:hypothetical protein I5535_10715 [Rhodobacteraceae bacterium F11138]|nr:hypothetical protein [Rhodobacteraceae bacterium F11138]
MTFSHPNRPDIKPDLTRWNRAGLSRFDYIDGDAAVWLEELRIAMLGLYLRGAPDTARTPEYWRDIYLRAQEDWPDAADAAARVAWKRLAPAMPPQQETRGRRTERLLKQYNDKTDDYSWELNRAFSRATHVLLGYLDAYANEGYLRTATQWDNLRRLAAMVNYQPTPPASATTKLALILKDDLGAVQIERGLAMKHTPAEGGTPMIFETLDRVDAHPALNAARAVGWNRNPSDLAFGKTTAPAAIDWHLPSDQTLAPGDLVVLANGSTGEAHSIDTITHDADAETASIAFADRPESGFPSWSTRLFTAPDDVRTGLRQTKSGGSVVKIAEGGGFIKGDIVEWLDHGDIVQVEVLDVIGDELILNADLSAETDIRLRPMLAFALDDSNKALAAHDVGKMYFLGASGPYGITGSAQTPPVDSDPYDTPLSQMFSPASPKTRRGHVSDPSAKPIKGQIKHRKPVVLPGKTPAPTRTVSFLGKPPKGLAENDWFVARDLKSDELLALQVHGVRVSSGEYHVLFSQAPAGNHEDTEFHGPLKSRLAAVGHDRNPQAVISGATATLSAIPESARQLLKPGRQVIISRTGNDTPQDILATLTAITPKGDETVEIALDPSDSAAGWSKGETTFHLNTAMVSHGETKGSKVLGSGDGERAAQVFELAVKDISHIPSTSTESGVIPDIDVTVNGQRWDYRDYIDPTAEGTRSWSTTLTDDGKLRCHFRRRLITGQNNVVVTRHRVGTGLAGTGIPPRAFTKPMKKHRYVIEIYQPFHTSGGANREPLSKLRQSAPSRMTANGRAVSLADFERLAMRNAAILRAHAKEIATPTAMRRVVLTLVPTGGAALTDSLRDTLRPAILNKCIPGVSISFREFETLPLHLGVTVRADLSVNDKSDIKSAAEDALTKAFSLEVRDFSQTAYVSEVLAVLETVPGIENAIATRFDLGNGYDLFNPRPPNFDRPWPRNVATRDNAVAAIYATPHQVIHIPAGSAGNIAVTVEDI